MTTVRQATRRHAATERPVAASDTRLARRRKQRRLVREEIAAVLVLAVILAVVLVMLGLQWLDTSSLNT